MSVKQQKLRLGERELKTSETKMVVFGGKKVGQVVAGIGGNGLGQILAAVATALLFRLFSGPGPALPPEADQEDRDDFAGDSESGESTADGKVLPVTIRWRNINCSLSDKSSKSVSSFFSWIQTLIFCENLLLLSKS